VDLGLGRIDLRPRVGPGFGVSFKTSSPFLTRRGDFPLKFLALGWGKGRIKVFRVGWCFN